MEVEQLQQLHGVLACVSFPTWFETRVYLVPIRPPWQ